MAGTGLFGLERKWGGGKRERERERENMNELEKCLGTPPLSRARQNKDNVCLDMEFY